MIKKALFTFILLFAIYNVILYAIDTKNYVPQNINQDNQIKIQEFYYSEKNKNAIIVGSSASAKIEEAICGRDFYNLAFRGRSVYDGITILKTSNTIPKYLFIEINYLQRAASLSEDDTFLNPYSREIKRKLLALQEKNQPVNRLLAFLDKMLSRKKSKSNDKDDTPETEDPKEVKNDGNQDFFKRIIEKKVEEFNQIPENKAKLDKQLSTLKVEIEDLEKKGVKIVFFEMPFHPNVCNSKGFHFLREEVKVYFPASKYEYWKLADCNDFETKDGIHLISESAKKFSLLLLKKYKDEKKG
jgi:hypothetical protein